MTTRACFEDTQTEPDYFESFDRQTAGIGRVVFANWRTWVASVAGGDALWLSRLRMTGASVRQCETTLKLRRPPQ
jgi:hypothetical protein